MAGLSSVGSSVAAVIADPAGALKKAAVDTTNSFESALSKVHSAIAGPPKTGFTRGPTYEAGTIAGQTKAALGNSIRAVKSALHIQP